MMIVMCHIVVLVSHVYLIVLINRPKRYSIINEPHFMISSTYGIIISKNNPEWIFLNFVSTPKYNLIIFSILLENSLKTLGREQAIQSSLFLIITQLYIQLVQLCKTKRNRDMYKLIFLILKCHKMIWRTVNDFSLSRAIFEIFDWFEYHFNKLI